MSGESWRDVIAGLGLGEARDAAHARALLGERLAALERARDAAEAANEAKTRFLSSISHEIRSPLNAIYGYAQLLERNDGAGSLKAAKVIRRSSEHLSNLIEGLLDIAQVESGSLKLSREAVRFRAFLDQIIDMLELQASAKGLSLALDMPPGLPEFVRTDPKRLRQILINLITNAIKFTDQGAVTLKVHYRNELATFEVIDTGIGIAPADMERIFAPFERGEGAAQERSGVGLGLAITQALVQIMGGDIRVESTPGKGTRFTVRLMLSKPLAPPVEAPASRSLAHYLGHRRTVLVIDDDAAHRDMLKGLLEPQGLRVLVAENGPRGLALAAEAQPDLVLLDVMLGRENGWRIAEALRERIGPELKIVMLSGEMPEPDAMPARGPANDLFVTKPFAIDALLDVLAQQLALAWPAERGAFAGSSSPPQLPAALAKAAAPHLSRIAELVRIGHVRGIEAEIDGLARLGPDADGIVTEMRSHLDSFDLPALAACSQKALHP
ncbi:ATP-binding protein [Erythrobacter sp. T5W1-R]|uniref:ATP-binding response regulator n=1 Tax=Erythrobacter sp. T5W1-R TaxID=3101752 RepID=UPI002AFE112C|nr:ATP-binding protein [Erythrobacter sp. T5W1-R]MEA1618257.1 ATP-binding protein [Erythrobacter sp. T5W1-R]